jgi:7,8-dihydroneopterin aldolase/epimerase/oxygenase
VLERSEEKTVDSVFLNGMQFYGYHGVHPEETRLGQRFELDIEVQLNLRNAGASDDLMQTVNYSELFAISRDIVEGEPKHLIEAVAESIATQMLNGYPEIEAVIIEIRKPSAPVRSGGLNHVGIRIHRTRADLSSVHSIISS